MQVAREIVDGEAAGRDHDGHRQGGLARTTFIRRARRAGVQSGLRRDLSCAVRGPLGRLSSDALPGRGGACVWPSVRSRQMPEIRGNHAIENAAIAWVMELERNAGRQPEDTRYSGAPADIESPPRLIEIKAVGKESCRGEFLWLETRQVDEARSNPNFYVYVVENVRQGDPDRFVLKVYGGEQLQRLMARAKERRYFEVPIPVAEYDRARASV